MARYAVINVSNVVTNIVDWNGIAPWTPEDYVPLDADGYPLPNSTPTPQIVVADTDPPTAQIGYSYNPGDGTFTAIPEVPPSSPSFISRVLSALNPFK